MAWVCSPEERCASPGSQQEAGHWSAGRPGDARLPGVEKLRAAAKALDPEVLWLRVPCADFPRVSKLRAPMHIRLVNPKGDPSPHTSKPLDCVLFEGLPGHPIQIRKGNPFLIVLIYQLITQAKVVVRHLGHLLQKGIIPWGRPLGLCYLQ